MIWRLKLIIFHETEQEQNLRNVGVYRTTLCVFKSLECSSMTLWCRQFWQRHDIWYCWGQKIVDSWLIKWWPRFWAHFSLIPLNSYCWSDMFRRKVGKIFRQALPLQNESRVVVIPLSALILRRYTKVTEVSHLDTAPTVIFIAVCGVVFGSSGTWEFLFTDVHSSLHKRRWRCLGVWLRLLIIKFFFPTW